MKVDEKQPKEETKKGNKKTSTNGNEKGVKKDTNLIY